MQNQQKPTQKQQINEAKIQQILISTIQNYQPSEIIETSQIVQVQKQLIKNENEQQQSNQEFDESLEQFRQLNNYENQAQQQSCQVHQQNIETEQHQYKQMIEQEHTHHDEPQFNSQNQTQHVQNSQLEPVESHSSDNVLQQQTYLSVEIKQQIESNKVQSIQLTQQIPLVNQAHQQAQIKVEQNVKTQKQQKQLTSQTQQVQQKPSIIQQQITQQKFIQPILTSKYADYQNQIPKQKVVQKSVSQVKQVHQQKKIEQKKQVKIQESSNVEKRQVKIQDSSKVEKKKKKKKKVQKQQQFLPIVTTQTSPKKENVMRKQVVEQDQTHHQVSKLSIVNSSSNSLNKKVQTSNPNSSSSPKKSGPTRQMTQQKVQIQSSSVQTSSITPAVIQSTIEQVSQIISSTSPSAGLIIFEAQRQRIGSTLFYFQKHLIKHQKHIKLQKTFILNVSIEIQQKRMSKQKLLNLLKDYFTSYSSMCKDFYEKSYKFTKSDKSFTLNPLINMKQELKQGFEQMLFLRKSTGNDFHRLNEFITNTIQKNIVKTFTQYWSVVSTAQSKHVDKKDEFNKKQKQFLKRISKVEKVYTRGKNGANQDEDLFIQMTKFISQQKDYRQALIQYGMSLIPLKKTLIKAEQTFYQQLQICLNAFKNQCRTIFSLHPREFTLIQPFHNQIKESFTFQKLCDITDCDYTRSILLSCQKISYANLTDKQFQRVLSLNYFQQIVGNAVQLLKGTTSKSFELKNTQQQLVDTISGNLVIYNKITSQMKQKFIIKNVAAKIVTEGVVQVDQLLKGIIFDSNRTVRITFRDNDRAQQLICFLNQIQESMQNSIDSKK